MQVVLINRKDAEKLVGGKQQLIQLMKRKGMLEFPFCVEICELRTRTKLLMQVKDICQGLEFFIFGCNSKAKEIDRTFELLQKGENLFFMPC